MNDLGLLRAQAISHSLFAPASLEDAIERLGFVQADPIRSPARAQDLTLRHRVAGYRAGDLERRYASLEIEEDVLYAYGFLPRAVRRLLHPREPGRLPPFEARVLAAVRAGGPHHPRDLERGFGRERVRNAWGGTSKRVTQALERLHYQGFLRVARREGGVRLYEAASLPGAPVPPPERLRRLTVVVANILAPVPEKTLLAITARLRRSSAGGGSHRSALADLLRTGELEARPLDGIDYVLLPSTRAPEEPPRRVRFLAPFDPLVWDRRRFEHLWSWAYRFEAYTPPAMRLRGYYAMPLLWGERIIGWANADVTGGRLRVELGFVKGRPRERAFRQAADEEVARLEAFLGLGADP